MIVINFRDGSTKKYDLSVEVQRLELNKLGGDERALKNISGFWLTTDKHNTTLPMPWRFRRVSFFAEVLNNKNGDSTGERVTVQADGVRLSMTSYYGEKPKMVRVDLKHTGKQRFNPEGGAYASSDV